MSFLIEKNEGANYLLMGNEAIARGALEGGVNVATGYPGTPSSEIIECLSKISKEMNLYVEWSSNEKVALEVAAAASFAGLRSLCVMKQNGVNVGSDFLLHLSGSGTRGGMVLVPCEDPGALSSVNEGEARYFAKLLEIPLLEPGDFQEAKDMTKWAFELSEDIRNLVMLRSVTRLSHASGNVRFGNLTQSDTHAEFKYDGFLLDPMEGIVMSAPVEYKHTLQQEKLKRAKELFEDSPFNKYTGPEKPELLIITCSACTLYCQEAIKILGIADRVGLLKIGTTWPLPPKLIERYLSKTDQILIVEEVLPFMEENLKVLAFEIASEIGIKKFYGKNDGTLKMVGELNPNLVVDAITKILNIEYKGISDEYVKKAQEIVLTAAPPRELTFCPGCPHRSSYWSIHNALQLDGRKGFVCGDIGCYSLAMLPCGFSTIKTVHSMGSGTGVASGFGKLGQFGFDQSIIAVCGDSTFFHTAMPALVNAVHHKSDFTLIIMDNSGTAMTGFQPHPGLNVNAIGEEVPGIDIAEVCRAIGAKVEVRDPFDLEETQKTLLELMDDKEGVKVLVLRQICALSPEKKYKKKYEISIDEGICLGENCGCNRLCSRIFRCPGLEWDKERMVARIDDVICTGCGVCADICPAGAIKRKEAA
ncbi:MAG: thiamine pyrophosphate-dependent enzyme [Thermodesulfobacteriota bacterium]|nr:thiamine pyrophosphate-dependent enzyme [Thermodesulfobacteriota bacterium]